ncbi:MAG: AAA family ATPase [Eubacteriales bacterium]|nr:AAA family ATPase [Eubacteriales bacterium]
MKLIEVEKAQVGLFAMTDAAMVTALKVLSQVLAKHYGRKVVLLIDEYDVPLDKAFQTGYYNEMVMLIRSLFSNALKTNTDLNFAVLTGCLNVAHTFVTALVLRTAKYGRCWLIMGWRTVLKRCAIGTRGISLAVSIYCPWDVIKHTQILRRDREAEPQNYWANTSGNGMVSRFIGKADKSTKNALGLSVG